MSGATPSWFAPERMTRDAIEGRAEVPAAVGVDSTVAVLRISGVADMIEVGEFRPGAAFPADCPERHINLDGTFCLGFGAGKAILSLDEAIVWWGLLEEYLKLQRVAALTHRWPLRKAIAHGGAGPHHVAALDAARRLGLEEDYYEMLEGEPKWFGGQFPRVHGDANRLLNGRLPCPCGCSRKGRPNLRRDCPRKLLVVKLVREERLRRKKERAFREDCRHSRRKCCGTMKDCPLGQAA